MVPDDSGDDKTSVVVVSDSAPRPASASPTRGTSSENQVTQSTSSDSIPTVAAPAPPPQEPTEEQQSQLKHEQPQQQQPPQEQKEEQHHEPQPQSQPQEQSQPQTQTQTLPPPQPQQNGDDSRASETNTTTPVSEADMASHRPALHGMHAGYPTSSSSPIYPQTSLPTTQYASYSTVTAAAQQGDAYRVSPVGTPQMSLPSMRTIDAMSQQSVPPMPHHSMSMGMSMPLTAVSTPPYFTSHSAPLPSNYGFPQDALARYPLPHDPRLINHRGPKKEIKRRTKTGCLTCRKRRIKCDETHPTCNNCRKSKRECLGYDPIFRQQPGTPTSSSVQPVSNSLSQPEPSGIASVQSGSAVGPPTPRLVNSYGSQSPMLPSGYATSSNPGTPSIPPSTYNPSLSVSVKPELGYGYSASGIDPAVRTMSAMPANQMSLSGPDNSYLRAKKMKIDEIIDLLGPPAPVQQISHTEETFNEITKVYHEMYASGLSAFFETSWYYFTDNGKMTFPKDANLIEHMATFLKILEAVKANDHTQMAYSGVLETRIVWELACTAYQIPDRANNSMRLSLPPDNDPIEAKNRLLVVEALLCGDELQSNPLAPPVADADHHRVRQFDFWYSLAEFVRRRDNPNAPSTVKIREDVLSRMRHLLDGRENRDVLYSIAVVRELAPNFDSGYAATIPQHLDESDPKNRLAVASKFILDESQVTGGTTNVVRRFSDIASRAFVNPGVNIARRV
ncbi:fungal zn(2)-Cys(6) binuclear cluster domain-containing protein [Trichoderma breve]|uniref:Fungal zn(2)-Cys(6) binuclear cluster domain-containing protein n=1 Tax=Trichoderma breve TaxID=2034170 RepID=A0A9W9BDC9_9HYPO|nr:fungal zn(2)-Cys(6) binuclear cluster domain-containing protein [Trichoderma breve]KAJ4861188.1 fungal zn(2)-Cys(6) binuclear cluster domain-containing protein [Trichoderma breve]